jgi:anti-sigma regulatory factor (Ser/Thr protein kinase)
MPETLTLPGLPSMVPLARRAAHALVAEVLPDGTPRDRDIALVVSELTTNAILHSTAGQGGAFDLSVDASPGRVRIEVADPGAAASSTERDVDGHDEYQRGLMIVAEFADKWGHDKAADGRSVRWAEFRWTA